MKLLRLMIALILTSVLLLGCGIGKDVMKRVESTEAGMKSVITSVDKAKAEYETVKKSENFAFFAPYAEREKWDDYYVQAKEEIAHANSIFEKEVRPILKKNDGDDEAKLKKILGRVQKSYKLAASKTKIPQQRKMTIEKYRAEAPSIVSGAQKSLQNADVMITSLSKFADQAKVDYPSKVKDITGRFSAFTMQQKVAHEKMKIAESELKNHNNKKFTDYANLGDSAESVQKFAKWNTAEDVKIRSKVGELYKSYSKILLDMKDKHKPWVLYVKYKWDEYSDWDTTTSSNDKRYVSQTEYEKWAKILSSNPGGYKTSSGYDYEVLVEDADVESYYYHRYTIVKDGKKSDTDWIQVNEDVYEDNFDYLGMEIVSKPYGVYEEEKITEAAPPGMAHVGNTKHGQWKKDSSGQSFWYYYGIYSFMNGNNHNVIYRDRYNDWNSNYRNESAYYGRTKTGSQRWGTSGSHVRTSSKYKGSTFSKNGGLKTAPVSARSAGSSMRGGGPGGGGK